MLVTPLAVDIGTEEVRIGGADGGVKVRFDASQVEVSTEHHAGVEKQYAPSVDLTRVLFAVRGSAAQGEIALDITPI
ncbi:hypothetical protein N8A98_13555 [Devosia neptuniae]|uniref:Uncharacterized protein n=1 Tax=Devosia neptuniae TaxID=191302 RepID=A0ABY6C838_9HYPH|nr:hypothetical protein [Devosia neptuniae]UXN68297.1 hypothetical protein N8A98_13555 [Devosia neptuniae]